MTAAQTSEGRVRALDRADLALQRATKLRRYALGVFLCVAVALIFVVSVLSSNASSSMNEALDYDLRYHRRTLLEPVMLKRSDTDIDLVASCRNDTEANSWLLDPAERKEKAKLRLLGQESAFQDFIKIGEEFSDRGQPEILDAVETRIKYQRAQAQLSYIGIQNITEFYGRMPEFLVASQQLSSPMVTVKNAIDSRAQNHLKDASKQLDLRGVFLYLLLTLTLVVLLVLLPLGSYSIKRKERQLKLALRGAKNSIINAVSADSIELVAVTTDGDEDLSRTRDSHEHSQDSASSQSLSLKLLEGDSANSLKRQQRLLSRLLVLSLSVLFLVIFAACVALIVLQQRQKDHLEDMERSALFLLAEPRERGRDFNNQDSFVVFLADGDDIVAEAPKSKGLFIYGSKTFFELQQEEVEAAINVVEKIAEEVSIWDDKKMKARVQPIVDDLLGPTGMKWVNSFQTELVGYCRIRIDPNSSDTLYVNSVVSQYAKEQSLNSTYQTRLNRVVSNMYSLAEEADFIFESRQEDAESVAKVAVALAASSAVLLAVTALVLALSERRLSRVARVTFNATAWSLDRMLADEECWSLLEEYTVRRLCAEQVRFVKSLRSTHWHVTGLTVRDALQLYKQFIVDDSENQVNVSAQMRRNCTRELARQVLNKEGSEKEQQHALLDSQVDTNDVLDERALVTFVAVDDECRKLIMTNDMCAFLQSDAFRNFDESRQALVSKQVELLQHAGFWGVEAHF